MNIGLAAIIFLIIVNSFHSHILRELFDSASRFLREFFGKPSGPLREAFGKAPGNGRDKHEQQTK
jgi:hypothetical protein